MENLHKLWWGEEVNTKFQVLNKFCYSMSIFGATAQLVWSLIIPEKVDLVVIYIPYSVLFALLSILIYYSSKKGVICKTLVSIAFSEGCCLNIWTMARNPCKTSEFLVSTLSIIYINSFELPFIESPWLKSLIIVKHLFIYHYINYLNGKMEFWDDYMPHLFTICILFLYNLNSYYISVKSFERFLSKKSAEERLNVVINLFTDGILIISENNQILYSNDHFNDLLGCSQNEILTILGTIEYSHGRKYTNLTNSNYLIDDINCINNFQVNQEVCFGLSSIRENNLEWKGKKVLWDEKEAILIIAHNANSIIQLEQALSDNKLKNILLRSVSHELRTPINAITFFAESLLSESSISESKKHKEKLNMISVSSKLLISLINDLLDYSRMLTGVFMVQKSKFLLRDVINNTLQLIKTQAEQKGLDVIIRIDPDLPAFAYTDPIRLSQIFLNLLSNSLKFTLKGYIEVCCIFSAESKLKVEVSDTGIGVEEEKIKNIFEEFHTTRTPNNPDGCGLGLNISNRIAKELGGQAIEVQSTVDKGSTFSFVADIIEESIEKKFYENMDLKSISEEKYSIFIKDINKIRDNKDFAKILIADDNEFNRMILGEILKSNSILYDEVCTGKQAVDIVMEMDKKNRPYQIVIMDGSMPEMNGWEATKKIISLYKSKIITNLPIVIGYTAFTSEADLTLCLESGMKECLIKPGSPKSLLDIIHRYLLI